MLINSLCVSCLCNVCKCGKHHTVTYSYKGRIPKADASKKEWLQFIELFLSHHPEAKAVALRTLEAK